MSRETKGGSAYWEGFEASGQLTIGSGECACGAPARRSQKLLRLRIAKSSKAQGNAAAGIPLKQLLASLSRLLKQPVVRRRASQVGVAYSGLSALGGLSRRSLR
jgi:hypothetical protein